MSRKDISRMELMLKIQAKQLTKAEVAETLNLSKRQVYRIYQNFKKNGVTGLLPKKSPKTPHNKIPEEVRKVVGDIISKEIYKGFGPLLMSEKLKERHQIIISKETVRKIMIEYSVWDAGRRKAPVVHPLRQRREKFGELVQIDGSHHAWFEDRGDPCVLVDFIDDATGKIVAMKFFPGETTDAYFITAREHIIKYGRPLAYYSDRDSIFKTTRKEGIFRKTQFTRALSELGITIFCANSPQAKGRVERGHRVFQDRLIKEMRLRGISTIEEANDFIEEFIVFYNDKFAKPAKSDQDAHRSLLLEQNLHIILAHKEDRKVSKNFTISYENITYQLLVEKPTWEMRKSKVTVVTSTEGKVTILFRGNFVNFRIMEEHEVNAEVVRAKEINRKIINIQRFLKNKRTHKPDKNHPYKRGAEAKIKHSKQISPNKERLNRLKEQNREDNLEAFNDR